MASPPTNGTIVTQVRRKSSAIDATRSGWPNSSFVPLFNASGGPSATEALDGATGHSHAAPAPAATHPREVAELIDQGALSLGDGLQRGTFPPRGEPVGEPGSGEAEGKHAPQADIGLHLSEDDTAVPIEVRRLPTRGGRRPSKERYPFGAIGLAREADGFLEGESFLIPHDDAPRRRIAAGRKRHKLEGKRFLTRSEETGVRVWRDR